MVILIMLGIALLVAVLFCAALAEFLLGQAHFELYRTYIAATLGGLAMLLLLLGSWLAKRRNAAGPEERSKLALLVDLRFLGVLCAGLAGITYFVHFLELPKYMNQARARLGRPVAAASTNTTASAAAAVAVKAPAQSSPVEFPSVKIQGLILSKGRPSIIVNGRFYEVGDRLGDAMVKQITAQGVMLEKSNEVKLVSLSTGSSTDQASRASR